MKSAAMLTLEAFKRKTPDVVHQLSQFVEIESPTSEKGAVDKAGEWIARQLNSLNAQVEFARQTQVGDHLIGRWDPRTDEKGILLLCHFDTVHPLGTLQTSPCIQHEGKLFGPGVQDMKSGIVLLLAAVQTLQENDAWPDRPVIALFTTDEETGSLTSRPLIESLARRAGVVFCLEPSLTNGALKTWRKGVGDFEILVRGHAVHAGAAHVDGRNAIEELAHQVIRVQGWTDYKRGTTLNVGQIQGGTASNVVPASARAVVDLRVMIPEEAERIQRQMKALQPVLSGTAIEVRGGLNRPPMPRDERMVATFEKARGIAAQLGISLEEGGTGGGSDANFVAPLGIPVLDGLGAVGEGQHSENEFVWIDRLAERAALLAALLTEW